MRDLLEQLMQQREQPLSPAIQSAFLAVDRGRFVPHYYRREGQDWVREETGGQAYKDLPLITKIEGGRPVSSSSMPSVMLTMLEALAMQPGQQVLEIGTGMGYNAALLSKMVGNSGHIVSVESDKELAREATQRLADISIENVDIVTADGVFGYQPQAPYHRIMATAAFRQIPSEWREQLATGGIFVGNLLGNLTSILLRLEKQEDGSLRGSPLPQGAFFMEMRSPSLEALEPIDWRPYASHPLAGDYREERLKLATLLKNQAFLLSLHCCFPLLQLHRRYNKGPIAYPSSFETWLIDPEEHESITLTTETIQSRGKGVWEKVQHTLSRWEAQKQPPLDAFRIRVSPQDEMTLHLPPELAGA